MSSSNTVIDLTIDPTPPRVSNRITIIPNAPIKGIQRVATEVIDLTDSPTPGHLQLFEYHYVSHSPINSNPLDETIRDTTATQEAINEALNTSFLGPSLNGFSQVLSPFTTPFFQCTVCGYDYIPNEQRLSSRCLTCIRSSPTDVVRKRCSKCMDYFYSHASEQAYACLDCYDPLDDE